MRSALTAAVLVAVLGVGWLGWAQLDRPVTSVRVQGALTASEQQAIRRAVSEGLRGGGILSVSVSELTERIHALSWPRTVRVRRVWPDTLEIRVEKESVVAAWGEGGYLNSAGDIVELADAERAVPTLSASLSSPRRAMEVYHMLESRVSAQGFSIERLEENPLGEWLITFENGMTLALGSEAIAERLERFLVADRRALSRRRGEIAHVDARYANGIAVREQNNKTPES